MENGFFTRDSLLALLHHSVLHSEPSAEEEDDDMEDLEEDSEDESEEDDSEESDMEESDMEESEEDAEDDEESGYYVVANYSYLSALVNLSTIGTYAYDATEEANAVNADAGMSYEQRMQAIASIAKQYRMDAIPYIVELIEHVFRMVDNVDEQAATLFEEISLLHLLGEYYQLHGTESRSAVTRAIFVKQLIDAYVLTR